MDQLTDRRAEHFTYDTLRGPAALRDNVAMKGMQGRNATMIEVHTKAGFKLPMHAHPEEQMIYVISGRIRMTYTEQPPQEIVSGEFVRFPPNVSHETEILQDTHTIEVFTPARTDMLAAR